VNEIYFLQYESLCYTRYIFIVVLLNINNKYFISHQSLKQQMESIYFRVAATLW